jgi:sigma-B regulation protein RsbU (phosphoserine phosphatase)
MPQPSARLQYAALFLITACSLVFTVLGSAAIWQNVFYGKQTVAMPMQFGFRLNQVSGRTPETVAAGIPLYAPIVSLNGRPFTGYRDLLEIVHAAHPGDRLDVVYLQPDGTPRAAAITLAAVERGEPLTWVHILTQDLLLRMLFPLSCVALGFWVVLAKPRDVNAWLLLGIFSFFTNLFFPTVYWTGVPLYFTPGWGDLVSTFGPICIMLFGIYFPQRLTRDVQYPWMKWLLIAPIVAFFPLDLWYSYGFVFSFSATTAIARHMSLLFRVENIFLFVQVTLFFTALAIKIKYTTAPDARRRLRVLYFGSAVSNAPVAALTIYSVVTARDFGDGVPQWLFVSALAIFAFFPVTLVYVVIVQRAMDVRILIRQGTRYAFARQSVIVLRICLGVLLYFTLADYFRHGGEHRTWDVVRTVIIVGIFFLFRFRFSVRLQQEIDQRFFREAYSSEQLLSELSDEARTFTESGPLLETITGRIGSTLHIDRIAVFLLSGESFQLALATGAALPASHSFSLPAASTTITTLARERAPANVYRDDPTSWLVDATDVERTALNDLSTELLVPLPGRNRLIGVMALGPKRSEEPYSRTDRQLLQSVASQTGFALENAELIQRLTSEVAQRERVSSELEIAREVQQRLFPQTVPELPGVGLAGHCRPAQAIGGDYFDYFLIPAAEGRSARLGLAIGDISGKGISAALLMASLRASLRSLTTLPHSSNGGVADTNLAAIISRVNNLVYESSTTNRYATFFYAEFDPSTRLLTYVNAGHNPPAVLRGGEAIRLEATGTVVGLIPDAGFEQASIALFPGDVLLAFTDGISEAMTEDEEEWGEDRMIECALADIAQPGCRSTAQQLLDCILGAADGFTAGAPQHDDMTLLLCTIG